AWPSGRALRIREEAVDVPRVRLQRGLLALPEPAQRLDRHLAAGHAPGGRGAPPHERERAEQAVHGHEVLVRAEDRLAICPSEEKRVVGTEQTRLRKLGGGRALGPVDEV